MSKKSRIVTPGPDTGHNGGEKRTTPMSKIEDDPETGSEPEPDPGPVLVLVPGKIVTWRSGNWRRVSGNQEPYNGLEITGAPIFTDTGIFISVAVTFDDYTRAKNGTKSVLPALTIVQGSTDIPEPAAPAAKAKFTVTGRVDVKSYTSGLYLGVDLKFGLPHQHFAVSGNIFGLEPAATNLNAKNG